MPRGDYLGAEEGEGHEIEGREQEEKLAAAHLPFGSVSRAICALADDGLVRIVARWGTFRVWTCHSWRTREHSSG